MTSEGAKGREQGSEHEKCLFSCSAHCPLAAASTPHELVSEAVFLPLYCGWQARWDRDSVATFCLFSKPCRVCLFVCFKETSRIHMLQCSQLTPVRGVCVRDSVCMRVFVCLGEPAVFPISIFAGEWTALQEVESPACRHFLNKSHN